MPPFEGVAVNVTFDPAHIVVVDTEIETVGFDVELTVILMAFELAVVLAAHGLIILILQVTTSPWFKVLVANVALLVPTFEPFTFH